MAWNAFQICSYLHHQICGLGWSSMTKAQQNNEPTMQDLGQS